MTLFLLSVQRAPVAGPFPQMGQLWGLSSKSPQCSPEPACKCGSWFHVWVWGQTGGQQPLHVSLLHDEMAWWWGRSFLRVMGWHVPFIWGGCPPHLDSTAAASLSPALGWLYLLWMPRVF